MQGITELLDYLSLAPGQVAPNGWRTIISCMVMWKVSSNGREDLTVDEFLFCYELYQIVLSSSFWTFKHRDMETRIVQGLPSSNRTWKDGYVFVYGDNWERLPHEDPNGDFVKVCRSWGTPSSSGVCFSSNLFAFTSRQFMICFVFCCLVVLDRPLLNSVWKERISRILDIEDRRYSIFIEPNLLASFSFGLAPNCYEPTKNVSDFFSFFFFSFFLKCLFHVYVGANTVKLNKGKLRKLA